MSIRTTDESDVMEVVHAMFPRDNKGRPVKRNCPDLNCGGRLRYDGGGLWRCDGLKEYPNGELDACDFAHFNGEPYSTKP